MLNRDLTWSLGKPFAQLQMQLLKTTAAPDTLKKVLSKTVSPDISAINSHGNSNDDRVENIKALLCARTETYQKSIKRSSKNNLNRNGWSWKVNISINSGEKPIGQYIYKQRRETRFLVEMVMNRQRRRPS